MTLILSHAVLPVTAPDRKRSPSIDWNGEIATFSHKAPGPHAPYHSVAAVHSGEMLGAEAAKLLIGRTNRTLSEERQVVMVPMAIVESSSEPVESPAAVVDDSSV